MSTDTGKSTADLVENLSLFHVLPTAIDAIGTSDFEKLLADAVGAAIDHDFITMARYSTRDDPRFLIHSHTFPSHLAELYLKKYVSSDPYVPFWRQGRTSGVVWLQELTRNGAFSRYTDEFLPQIDVTDEIGVFAPAVDTDSVAFFFNKRRGQFHQTDVDTLDRLYPTIAALYRQHIRALILADEYSASPSLGRPWRTTNALGTTIWMTNEWHQQNTPQAVPIRTSIAQDFNVGNRFVWTIYSGADATPAMLEIDQWVSRIDLTPRERDIVRLTLQGHSTAGIAQTLDLSVGNIKNHKRRIYGKLDITSERELFLLFFAALTVQS
ncbi:helix-turn-helix transcriptional regulator [Aliisedimentitalea scapharcae]|uniref:Helix-turn-helix transcriptional regulator n=1 Tax=Aliisedimentitalea scapharcae TaxID=1524259 RepID=A0ABZ2XYF4_9RHOB